MNTRVQVEHPVTELVTGINLVTEQLLVALSEPLSFGLQDVHLSGHAIECWINAEDPFSSMPCPGTLEEWVAQGGPGIQVDSHLYSGYDIPPH